MKKILHLEDNEKYHLCIEQEVNRRVDIITAYTLEEALKKYSACKKEIGLVITDYCLVPQTKDNGGLQFVLKIRRGYEDSPKNKEIPIIMYSSEIDRIRHIALEAGVNDFVLKGDNEGLKKALSKYLD